MGRAGGGWRRRSVMILLGSSVALLMLLAAAAGAYLVLRLSSGPANVVVPDLTNLTEEEAARRVVAAGLKLEVAGERYDRQVDRGKILGQEPPGGARTRAGRTVKIIRSLGDAQITIPDLVGRPAREARLAIQQIGLRGGVTTFVRWGGPEDRVLAQQPRGGEMRSRGDPVDLLIDRGSRPKVYVMPDLVGRTAESSKGLLERSGLRVAEGGKEARRGIPAGTVFSQNPAAGLPVRERQIVTLAVTE